MREVLEVRESLVQINNWKAVSIAGAQRQRREWSSTRGPHGPDHEGLVSHVREFELYPKSNGKPFNEFWHRCNMIRFAV